MALNTNNMLTDSGGHQPRDVTEQIQQQARLDNYASNQQSALQNANPLVQNYLNYAMGINDRYKANNDALINHYGGNTAPANSGPPTGGGTSYKTGITIGDTRYDTQYDIGGYKVGQASYHPTGTIATPANSGANGNNTPNMTPPDGNAQTQNNGQVPQNGGGYSSGGYGGGGISSSVLAALSQMNGGTGLTGIGTGVGTGTPYAPITQPAVNSEQAAAIYAQLLQNAGYDLSQPLTDIPQLDRVDLPNQVELPENFNFLDTWNNLPEVNVGRINHIDTHPEEEMLGQIADLQGRQAVLSADNTVNNGITELQRVMENAQDQFRTQQNQIASDEARAKDNQALYNEARGDRGGIGQAQYDTIQNTAATNRLTVQKEQTQLATDTARQIADLRSQGEFEKANQLLSISQKYLSELMDLYQWAKETNLGVDEFNLQVEQWEENFKLSLVGAELDADAFNLNLANARIDQENNLFNARFNQEKAIFDAMLNAAKLRDDEALARLNAQLTAANATGAFANGTPTYAATQDAIANQLKERSMLADIGTALIKAGIQPSEQILAAMGMGGTATGTAGVASNPFAGMDATSVLRQMGIGNSGLAGLSALGYTPEQFLAEAFGYSTTAGLPALGTTTVPTGGEQMYTQLTSTPTYVQEQPTSGVTNVQSQVAAYNGTPTYTDANVYAAFGADPETVLRAAGIGSSGLAGLAALGITPAQFVGQAFGL